MSGFMYGFQQVSSMPVCTPSRENCITGQRGYENTGCDWHADITDAPALPERLRPEDIESFQQVRRVEGISEERLARVRLLMAEVDAENGQKSVLELPSRYAQDAQGLPAGEDVIEGVWRFSDIWLENVEVRR